MSDIRSVDGDLLFALVVSGFFTSEWPDVPAGFRLIRGLHHGAGFGCWWLTGLAANVQGLHISQSCKTWCGVSFLVSVYFFCHCIMVLYVATVTVWYIELVLWWNIMSFISFMIMFSLLLHGPDYSIIALCRLLIIIVAVCIIITTDITFVLRRFMITITLRPQEQCCVYMYIYIFFFHLVWPYCHHN